MSASAATEFVDFLLEDGWLVRPEELLESMRNPSGRSPRRDAGAVSEALAELEDEEALRIIRSVLDAATFGFFAAMDSNFKNSGLRARLQFADSSWDSAAPEVELHELYRQKVSPAGLIGNLP